MKKMAIFDLDGTLVDSLTSIGDTCNEALVKHNLSSRDMEEYKYFAGDGAFELVKRAVYASGDEKYEKLQDVYNEYKKIFEKDCTRGVVFFKDIDILLQNLKDKGIKLAILSNKPHERTIDVVNKIFGDNLFDMVLGCKDEETKKPNPYGALLICERFNIEPKDCVYIGDTDTDIKTGKNAGMYTIGVTWGFRDEKELIENNADNIVNSPLEILKSFN